MKTYSILIRVFFFSLLLAGSSTSSLAQKDSKNDISNNRNEIQMTTLSTFILFNGDCKQAMEFYKSCFGGELVQTSVGQSPMKNAFPEIMHGKIVNARLSAKNMDISASDWLRPTQTPVKGNMVCLYLSRGTPAHLKNLFDKLSDGADITDPLKAEPFGVYGALNDKFGVRWMFYTDQKE